MGFPEYGVCPTNTSHTIQVSSHRSKKYIANKCCDRCTVQFDHIYFRGRIVAPHYYHCKRCNSFICFNCAKSTNITYDNGWKIPWRLPYPSTSKLRRPPPIKINRLKINELIDNLNYKTLGKCVQKFIKLLGGNKSILQMITKHAKQSQLEEMYKIVAKQSSKHYNHTNRNHKHFTTIPKTCLLRIVSYLNKDNVAQFKLSSRQISIACLEHMRKVLVKEINGNYVLNNTNIDLHDLQSFVTEERYNNKRLFGSLIADWDNKYKIPANNQLVFQHNPDTTHHTTAMNLFWVNTNKLKSQMLYTRQTQRHGYYYRTGSMPYLIVDTRNVVVVANEAKTFDNIFTNNNFEFIKDYELLILRYFDVMKQQCSVVQYILYQAPTMNINDLLNYIENNFIQCSNNNNEWYCQLNDVLSKMGSDPNEPKLCFYESGGYDKLLKCSLNQPLISYKNLLTFQINTKHQWCATNGAEKIDEIIRKCEENNITFQANAATFCKNFVNVSVHIKTDKKILKNIVLHHYNSQLNLEEKEIFKADMETILDLIDIGETQLKINSFPHIVALKKKMSKFFGFIIDPKYIIFTNRYDNKYLKSTDSLPSLYWSGGKININCYVVWNMYSPKLKLTSLPTDSSVIYKVNLFTPSECPHPFEVKYKPKANIVILYRKRFKVGNFIRDVIDSLRRSMDYMSCNPYQNFLSVYYDCVVDDNDSDDDMVEPTTHYTKSNKIKLFLCGNGSKYLEMWDTYDALDTEIITFKLYMIQIKPNDINKDIKVRIKFESYCFWTPNIVGLPLNVWINENDTLQYIIDTYLKSIKKYISKCYRVKKNKQRKTIKIHRWCGYKLSKGLDLKNEFLLFKLRATWNQGLILTRFQQIHDTIDNIKDIDVEIEMELSPTPPPYVTPPPLPPILYLNL